MPDRDRTTPSPVGRSVSEVSAERAERSEEYRKARAATAPYQAVARELIKYRMEQGLTQQELADRVGTSHSQISRIESGRHGTSLRTLTQIAEALELDLLVTFEPKAGSVYPDLDKPTRSAVPSSARRRKAAAA